MAARNHSTDKQDLQNLSMGSFPWGLARRLVAVERLNSSVENGTDYHLKRQCQLN
jgi:hypothetical protein